MLEILYLAWNRLAFTRASFEQLRENTDWSHVDRLVVYDDGSEDGTREFLDEAVQHVPVPAAELRYLGFGHPAATMNDYLASTEADVFVKIDNDIAVPPLWLEKMLSVWNRQRDLDLLGMEVGHGSRPRKGQSRYGVIECSHIGGVGLMRTKAFHRRPAIPSYPDRQGFTHWQHRHKPKRGWIDPYLLTVALDRIPVEPWRSLSDHYTDIGWQRTAYHWRYTLEDSFFWAWLPSEVTA